MYYLIFFGKIVQNEKKALTGFLLKAGVLRYVILNYTL